MIVEWTTEEALFLIKRWHNWHGMDSAIHILGPSLNSKFAKNKYGGRPVNHNLKDNTPTWARNDMKKPMEPSLDSLDRKYFGNQMFTQGAR